MNILEGSRKDFLDKSRRFDGPPGCFRVFQWASEGSVTGVIRGFRVVLGSFRSFRKFWRTPEEYQECFRGYQVIPEAFHGVSGTVQKCQKCFRDIRGAQGSFRGVPGSSRWS